MRKHLDKWDREMKELELEARMLVDEAQHIDEILQLLYAQAAECTSTSIALKAKETILGDWTRQYGC